MVRARALVLFSLRSINNLPGAIAVQRHRRTYHWFCCGLLGAVAVLAPVSSSRAQAPSQGAVKRPARKAPATLTRAQVEAQQECKNSINSRPGYQVTRIGTPVLRAKHAWDVALTVRRDGEVDQRATCRFDSSTGRVTLRPR